MSEDPRAQKDDICRLTFIGATGIEWICIRKVHYKIYKGKKNRYIPSNNPNVDRHYWVPRYPNRKEIS